MRVRRIQTLIALGVFLAVARLALATPTTCTIHPKKKPARGTVKESELESEHGCLVYSFDIAVAGETGVLEVQVDAGNGKLLSSERESRKAEAAEKAKETAPRKP